MELEKRSKDNPRPLKFTDQRDEKEPGRDTKKECPVSDRKPRRVCYSAS